MEPPKKKRIRKWTIRILLTLFLMPMLLFAVAIAILYTKQAEIVQYALTHANKDIKGKVKLSGSHIALVENFPMVSIDLEQVEIFESKEKNADRLVQVKDVYLGFNIWEVLSGNIKIHKIKLKDGHLDIKQHVDGTINVANALSSNLPPKEVSEDLHLDLSSIELVNMDINKLNEATMLKLDILMNKARCSFQSNKKGMDFSLDSDFFLSVIQDGDSTFFKHKHVHFGTDFTFTKKDQRLKFNPTTVEFEKTLIDFQGEVGVSKDMDVDVKLKGHKPNFNLFLSFAPKDVADALGQFDNKGKVYFNATIKGKTANGNQPSIVAHFGCSEGMLTNTSTNKRMQDIGFVGYFTNGTKRNVSTMEFSLKGFKLKPELGRINADISVKNFEEPEIDMKLQADVDLDFLSRFSKWQEIRGMGGKVAIDLRFHDIVDLNHPEHALRELNQAYFAKLKVTDFRANVKGLEFPIKDLDLEAEAKGHAVSVSNFGLKYGNSDVSLSGSLSDLPAVIHHTDIPVRADFNLSSNYIDFAQLSTDKSGEPTLDENLSNFKMKGQFLSSAKAMIESKNLPSGEFKINELSGKLQHYPHGFHDVHMDLFINEQDLSLKEFKGFVDHSDFHLSGMFRRYDFWFQPQLEGTGEVQINFLSNLLVLKELLHYAGYNHLPEQHRSEEVSKLNLRCHAETTFQKGKLDKAKIQLDALSGKLKSFSQELHHFSGLLSFEQDLVTFNHVNGSLGNSDVEMNGHYHFSNPKYRNNLNLKSKMLDLRFLEEGSESTKITEGAEHDKKLSLYDYDFPNLDIALQIDHFLFSPYELYDLHFDAHFFEDHHIDVNHIRLKTAEGSISGKGTFSGRDKTHIYFAPNLTIHHINLDKFMLKFDNFGQDHLVSENLHGFAEGKVQGKIHLHADLVPNLDHSELEIDVQVTNGRLENYEPLVDLGTYFEDKDVSSVKFDTLTNVFRLKNGKLTIPEMVICSSLGFLKISGNQSISGNMPMQYQIGIPWSMVKDVARNKIFKNKKDNEETDEIITEEKKAKYIYFKVDGDMENFKVTLMKKKKRKE